MDPSLIEIVGLAFVAGFILYKLYATLGRRTGAEPPPQPQPAQGAFGPEALRARLTQPSLGPTAGGDGVLAIMRADPNFDAGKFLAGARGAYELILAAFAKGDRAALKPLLTPRVYDLYDAAITKRQAENGVGPELVRLKGAEITDATLQGNVARLEVKFESELAEGAHMVRDARERWTFERDIRAPDPNWRLARVAPA